MKIAYKHVIDLLKEKPTIDELSDNLFQLGHEHEIENEIFDIEITPNRGDCLSLLGICRDLNCFYENEINLSLYDKEIQELDLNFKNNDIDTCPQISFLKVQINEEIKPYKQYLKKYFNDLEIKKNNFFTDISNYLSYEIGQPTHCYDWSKMDGKFTFKEINQDINFDSLLDTTVNLNGKNSVFMLNNEVINLAGVMGGKSTKCSNNTKTVLIECAYFKPENIIGKTIKYGLNSDAAYKFERGVDPTNQIYALKRFAKIISDHCTIKSIELFSKNYQNIVDIDIAYDLDKINKILGTSISDDIFSNILLKLGFKINTKKILVPKFRHDIKNQNDIAEEIARVIGYDNIKRQKININSSKLEHLKNDEGIVKSFLVDNGFMEVINSSFSSEDKKLSSIKVDNPLDSTKRFIRHNLKKSLVDNLLYNERRQQEIIKFFEISDVYTNVNGVISKKRKLGVIASGRVANNYKSFFKKIDKNFMVNLFDGILANQSISIEEINRNKLDSKIKNPIIYFESDLEDILKNMKEYNPLIINKNEFKKFTKISEYPSIIRDLSYAVHDHSKSKILQKTILEFKSKFLKDSFIFDYFENEKDQSIKIGFRFIFQSLDKTMTDEEVNKILDQIISKSDKIKGIEIPGL